MRKRILSALMAFVMVAAMLPVAAVTAWADYDRTVSSRGVEAIKTFEGFRSTAYLSGGQWSIGYGTSAEPGETITQAEAEQALRAHLTDIEEAINDFAFEYDLDLSQSQFDALASFSYNCGTGWMQDSGRFHDAIVNGGSKAEFLFGISLWANNGSVPDYGLLNRRMAEADMYLNGVYAKKSSNLTYTIFNANGGYPGMDGEDKMQGYDKRTTTDILVADPEKDGYTFTGWYTASSGGTKVTKLSSSTAEKTLYAHYEDDDGNAYDEDDGTAIASGQVYCATYLNVRKGAGTGYAIVDRIADGTDVNIYETTKVGSTKWGRIGTNKWVCMDYIRLDDDTDDYDDDDYDEEDYDSDDYEDGVVTAYGVNVRKGAGTGYSVVKVLNRGAKVKVYDRKTVSGRLWGKIDGGWICMDYVDLDSDWEDEDTDDTDDSTVTGRVNSTTTLNVRSGPGTGYTRVGSLTGGSKITIFERRTVNGTQWGRIANSRWVCMDYITLDRDDEDEEEQWEDEDEIGTGRVNSSTQLNVRSGPGTGYSRVKTLTPGTSVTIYETKTVSGVKWGRIGTNRWVCMDYITMDDDEVYYDEDYETGYATVSSSTLLNVRAGAGTGYRVVTRLKPGTEVEILEQKYTGYTWWGRIDEGWVCMDYIEME